MRTKETNKKLLSNQHIKRHDEAIVIGLIFSLSTWLFVEPKISANVLVCLFCGTTIFVYVWQKLFYSGGLIEDTKYLEKDFIGTIDDLILLMYRAGLVLKIGSGDRYIFKTTNIVLPNQHFVVKAHKVYCSILGHERCLRRLEETVFLQEKTKQDNDGRSSNRK